MDIPLVWLESRVWLMRSSSKSICMERFVRCLSSFVLSVCTVSVVAPVHASQLDATLLSRTERLSQAELPSRTEWLSQTNVSPADTTNFNAEIEPLRRVRVGTKEIVPFVFLDDEVPYGFSIELWDRVTDDLGFQTEWVRYETVSEMLAAGLATGQIDMAIAGISITAIRTAIAAAVANEKTTTSLAIGNPQPAC